MRHCRSIVVLILSIGMVITAWIHPMAWAGNDAREYVGAEACKGCHEEQYASFVKHSKKSRSFESIAKMRKGLTEAELKECYACHTTGYGRPGGFESEAKTPHLKAAGCEVCHGPGSLHADSRDRGDIKARLTVADCETCHNAERVGAFKYRPLIYGGAH